MYFNYNYSDSDAVLSSISCIWDIFYINLSSHNNCIIFIREFIKLCFHEVSQSNAQRRSL